MLKLGFRLMLFLFLFSCQGCVGRFFYYPDPYMYDRPTNAGLPFEEVTFFSSDGTRLSGWFVPAVGAPKGTVIHFHGNAQNMTAHFGFVSWLPAEGFNVFVFDYRGYGKSAGVPDREGLFQDSVAALRYVASRPDLDPERVVLFGQSLGGTNAIAALGRQTAPCVKAAAIESAFASYRSIVREKIALVPVLELLKWPLSYLLIGDSHSAIDSVAAISPTPLLLVYTTDDPVIPISEGLKLYQAAKQPKELWQVPGNNHAGVFLGKGSTYRRDLVRFFSEALDSRQAVAPRCSRAGDSLASE